MSEHETAMVPTEIKLHKKSRLLEIAFADGLRVQYPCEYLRVSVHGDDAQMLEKPVYGKQGVDVTGIEPEGETHLALHFDDGCSASFSWAALHGLGENYEQNWNAYIENLKQHGLQRTDGENAYPGGKRSIKILYFIGLAKVIGKDEEELQIPDSVNNVETMLAWIRTRKETCQSAFAVEKVQVTVNKHFAEPFTLIEHGDEVAIVPKPD